MKLWPVAASILAVGLVGCSVTSGVRSLGPDTYTISVNDLNDATAKGITLGLAESHCADLNKRFLVTQMKKRHQVKYHYDVTFLCLDESDSRLDNPQYESVIN